MREQSIIYQLETENAELKRQLKTAVSLIKKHPSLIIDYLEEYRSWLNCKILWSTEYGRDLLLYVGGEVSLNVLIGELKSLYNLEGADNA